MSTANFNITTVCECGERWATRSALLWFMVALAIVIVIVMGLSL